jgi:membrane fusion protein (multidrug efflux system)
MPLIKKLLRIFVFWAGPLCVLAAAGWIYLHSGRYATTDNAYLKTEMVSISSEISGKVVNVKVTDTARVNAGDLLFRLDDQVYRIALAHAEANLLKVRSNIESLRADYVNQQADINKAKADLDYYTREFERLQKLATAVSEVQVDQAEYQVIHAQKQLESEIQALEVVKAHLVNPDLPVEQHPDYLLALVEHEKASLDLSHVDVYAPVSGILANFNVKIGEVVAASVPLFTLVDTSHLWVEANFKETDLTWMRVGQPATIDVDAYPDLHWQGVVASVTPGTGSEFSLLPAQNSSGNWVKVVQRITVKLEMEPLPNAPELAAGMSAHVEVDTGHKRELPGFPGLL